MNEQIKIHKIHLDFESDKTNALAFIPSNKGAEEQPLAIFCHGYTSHKASILNWAVRLAEEGLPSLIFDLPGHYLGSYCEVPDFSYFKQNAHKLFIQAHQELLKLTDNQTSKLVIGGHSLGAMLSLMALNEEYIKALDTTCLCVGLGQLSTGSKHLFQSPLYKSTLNIRSQLVSDKLCPENIFPWIDSIKKEIVLKDQRVHFITGKDDLVVGKDGSQKMVKRLQELDNIVTIEEPQKLPHHLPEQAAGYIKKFLKNEGLIL